MTPQAQPDTHETSAVPSVDTPQTLLESIVEPVVATMGYELVHLDWGGTGKHRKLVIFIDKPDGGFSLADCSRLSPIISNALDAAESDPGFARVLSAGYTLEVSSPGVDRPLSRLSHFERFKGGRAKFTTLTALVPGDKQKKFIGRIETVSPDPLQPENDRAGTITIVADDGAEHSISLALIRRANLIYEG